MQKIRFEEAVRLIRSRDQRFELDAYCFLRDALDFTVSNTRANESIEHQHVSGGELLEGFRDYALNEFGPMSATVLEDWGIHSCEDVGEMVFQLIEAGAFGKSNDDHPEDFIDVFDFDEAFRAPFRPKKPITLPVVRRGTGEPVNRTRNLTPGSRKRSSPADAPEKSSEAGANQTGNDGLS